MSAVELRRKIKKAVDRLPSERLDSAADYLQFLSRPASKQAARIKPKSRRQAAKSRSSKDAGDAAEARRRLADSTRIAAVEVFDRLGV